MSTTILNQENIIKKVFDPTTQALTVTGSVTTTPPVGGATGAKQDTGNASLASIDSKTVAPLEVYKVTTLIAAASTNISNVTYLTVEASTSQITRKIISIDDIGEYMELFTGAPASEVKLCALALGGGEVEVNVPAGTRLSIKSLGPVVTSGNIIFNLLK